MSSTGSCSATGNETLAFRSASPGRSASTNTTPAASSLPRAAFATASSSGSRPPQNDAGMPMRLPLSDVGGRNRRPGDDRVEQRHVGDRPPHRADGVAGAADRHHRIGVVIAALRSAVADRGTQTDGAGQRGGNAGRAAGVAAEPGGDDAGGDRRRGAAGGAAGNARHVMRILHRAGERRGIGRGDAEGKLVQIGLADHDGAGIDQLLQRRRIGLRPRIAQRLGAAGGRHIGGVDVVLHHDRQTGERRQWAPGRHRLIDLPRGRERAVGVQGDECIEVLHLLGAGERGLDRIGRGHALVADRGNDGRGALRRGSACLAPWRTSSMRETGMAWAAVRPATAVRMSRRDACMRAPDEMGQSHRIFGNAGDPRSNTGLRQAEP